MIIPSTVFDFRAAVDVEVSPGHTWVRQIPLAYQHLSDAAIVSLRKRQSVVPALLLRGSGGIASVSAYLQNLVGAPEAVELRLQNCGPQFGTYGNGSPLRSSPPFIAINPCRRVVIKLVDILAIRSRMYRVDWEEGFTTQYVVNGRRQPILWSELGFPRIQLPHDYSTVHPACPASLHTWATMQTVLLVPGIVLSLEIGPEDSMVMDNERCLFSITSIMQTSEDEPIAKIYPLSHLSEQNPQVHRNTHGM